jgi:hypothetical protein
MAYTAETSMPCLCLFINATIMVPFTFFACAKKVTKKAQPILMRDFSSLRHYQTKIGVRELDFIEHFASNNKQDGMNCLC